MAPFRIAKGITQILLLGSGVWTAAAQTPEQQFGQNRVQYKEFVWSYYESEHFTVFFYLGGQELARFVIAEAERQLPLIEKQLEFQISEPIDILIYNSIDDLKQTNIGWGTEPSNPGGITRLVGNKIFVYFDGDHHRLRYQIREGIAALILKHMMFGSSLGEVVQNAVLLRVPSWFTSGLASFVAEEWNSELDNELREGIATGRFRKLNRLTGTQARLAGHALWYFLATKYGAATIPNILYLSRINRSIESGFQIALGKSVKQVIQEFYAHFRSLYAEEASYRQADTAQQVLLRVPATAQLHSLCINHDASAVAFVRNRSGHYRVCVLPLSGKRVRTVMRGGYRSNVLPADESQPLLAFSPNENKLTIATWRRNKTRVVVYDVDKRKKEKHDLVVFQKIISLQHVDANTLALSAVNKGQSDIYLFHLHSGKTEQLTNDIFDDLDPSFVRLPTRQGIFFTSNRPTDTLRIAVRDTMRPLGPFNVFFYNTRTKSNKLLQVTHNPLAKERQVRSYLPTHFALLSNASGITNRYVGYIDSLFDHYDYYYFFPDSVVVNPPYNIDSLIARGGLRPDSVVRVPVYRDTALLFPVTNMRSDIVAHDVARRGGQLVQLRKVGNHYVLEQVPISRAIEIVPDSLMRSTPFMRRQLAQQQPAKVRPQSIPTVPQGEPGRVADTLPDAIQEQAFFLSQFSGPVFRVLPDTAGQRQRPKSARFSRILPYSVRFSTASVTTQMDNSLLITRYQPFNSYGGVYDNPDLNVFLSSTAMDLLEDYRITGGFRFPTQFDGTEYFLLFENLKHRLDKRFTVYRKSINVTYDATPQWYLPVHAKLRTYVFDVSLRYPFDFLRSVRTSVAYRNDRTNFLATDSFSLSLRQRFDDWVTARVEYVFDNTLKIQTNIYNGFRYKFFFDAQRQIDARKTYLFGAGLDVRHYLLLHRNVILATRLQGITTWGDQKVVFYLGGTENELFPVFNTATPVSQDAGYAFQALATSVRGFTQNVRNGNSAALASAELRLPLFSYLFSSPIRSELIRSFQVVAFTDAGTAWQGLSPYSKDNPFNTIDISHGPVSVHVNYFREPVVWGYGLGIRSTVLGYFLRVDYGRGMESGAWQPWRWHFSLGLDF